ncbi:MAG: hypothetical protein H7259_02970, partial [Cytophagales bacterium]|nr:hypothetical protein [Cytophaga sp.]
DTEGKQYYGTEVIDIFIFGLNLNQATIDWGNTILGKTKEMNSQMQAGFQTMKNGYKSTLTGLFMELEIEDLMR